MRLVIDGQRLTAARTGVGRCLEGLLAEWSESGWPLGDALLVARDPAGLARVPRDPGLAVEVAGTRLPGLVWESAVLARRLRPDDVLLAPASLVPWSWRGRTVLLLYDTLPWSVPDSFPWHVRWRFGWRYRLAARRATRVVVPSRATADDVRRVHKVPPDRLRLAYPGPEPEFRPRPPDAPEIQATRRALGLEPDTAYFLFVGKRSARRNVPAVLDAFARHRHAFPAHRLVFVGPSGGEPLPGPASGVIDGGHVEENRLRALLCGATALLYPSDYEGFGLPVVEAQASGCPVVTLANSALVESAGDAAYLLDAPTPDALARAMLVLTTDAPRRDALVARGLAHVARFRRSDFAAAVREEVEAVARETPVPESLDGVPGMTIAGVLGSTPEGEALPRPR